jgi:predicted permease
MQAQLREIPGVAAVTVASNVPLTGENSETSLFREGDAPLPDDAPRRHTYFSTVGTGYFATMGIPLVQGRDFTAGDRSGALPVAIVNETFAQRLWPGESAIGKRVSLGGAHGPWMEIVGVARRIRYNSLGEDPPVFLYLPHLQNAQRDLRTIVRLREGAPPVAVTRAIMTTVRALDPALAPPTVKPMDEEQRIVLLPARLGAGLTGAFGTLALLLAAVGIFGVAAYAVAQRQREIGIRSALGARTASIIRTVLGDTVVTVAVGGAIGLLLAAGAGKLLSSQLYGVGAFDPVTFVATPLVLGLVAFAASFVPARRAARVDPVIALRSE